MSISMFIGQQINHLESGHNFQIYQGMTLSEEEESNIFSAVTWIKRFSQIHIILEQKNFT